MLIKDYLVFNTKQLQGMQDNNNQNLPYNKCLQKLGALPLEKKSSRYWLHILL